jgi:mono/diheme cytochrome c family protein
VRAAPITALLVATLALSGCGGSALHTGKGQFDQRCGSCHALAPGALSPVAAAPNLSTLQPTRAEIEDAVKNGRPGMPRRLAQGENLDQIVNYILQETAK